jgi:hypothetical protein
VIKIAKILARYLEAFPANRSEYRRNAMDSQTGAAPRAVQGPLWQAQSWLGAATLESLEEINAQALALLRTQFLAGGVPPLFQDVSKLLLNLDASSLRRAAGGAVLLVDAGFADETRWTDAIVGAVNDRHPGAAAFFTVEGAVAVMRLVMTHAWHLARSEPAAARLLLGLSPGNAATIGGCPLGRLIQLAEARSQWLRPRWESRPGIWGDLLRTAAEGTAGAVGHMRIRSLQLLAAESRQG